MSKVADNVINCFQQIETINNFRDFRKFSKVENIPETWKFSKHTKIFENFENVQKRIENFRRKSKIFSSKIIEIFVFDTKKSKIFDNFREIFFAFFEHFRPKIGRKRKYLRFRESLISRKYGNPTHTRSQQIMHAR